MSRLSCIRLAAPILSLWAALLLGCQSDNDSPLATTQPGANLEEDSFCPTGPMVAARMDHSVTLLANGKVLVAGGVQEDQTLVPMAERYDPVSNRFTPTGNLNVLRTGHTATLLPDGQVLLAGGRDASGSPLASAERYDPVSGAFTPVGNLNTGRFDHQAVLLPNGKVLVAGGVTDNDYTSSTAELYDPATGSFTPTNADMDKGRSSFAMALLPDGRVLLAGGVVHFSVEASSTSIYDPGRNAFLPGPAMREPRPDSTCNRLLDGTVLLVGGNASDSAKVTAERYRPAPDLDAPGSFEGVQPQLSHKRSGALSCLLPNGQLLLMGGYLDDDNTIETYDPARDRFTTSKSRLGRHCYQTSAVLLPGGLVLIPGGHGSLQGGPSAHLYRPPGYSPTGAPPPAAFLMAPLMGGPGSPGLQAAVIAPPDARCFWMISNGTITHGAGTPWITFTKGGSGDTVLHVLVVSPLGIPACASATVE